MGYMRHHAIVVTSWNAETFAEAHAKAVTLFAQTVSPAIPSDINSYSTFLVGPDGSKEGWDEDVAGNLRRDEFIAWLKTQVYGDGSSCLAWAEIQYGDDELETKIVRDSDTEQRRQS